MVEKGKTKKLKNEISKIRETCWVAIMYILCFFIWVKHDILLCIFQLEERNRALAFIKIHVLLIIISPGNFGEDHLRKHCGLNHL